jgi:glutamate-5-semialdehyde dehydrogenase
VPYHEQVPNRTEPSLEDLAARGKAAGRRLASSSADARNDALLFGADLLERESEPVLLANAKDVEQAETGGADATILDRLRLTPERIGSMAEGLRAISALPDPVGEVTEGWTRPNGLRVERVRVPLGLVGIIYENRPNVTSDAAGLCLKSGNAVLLRGSGSAQASNAAICTRLRAGLAKAGLPEDGVALVADTSHEAAVAFMQLDGYIDCLIPRGGPSLLASVREHATVPTVIDGAGNCHVYVDAGADLDMAESIVANAKLSRPGVCNAAESVLVHEAVATEFLPRMQVALAGVRLMGDAAARRVLPDLEPATSEDFATEFLSLALTVGVVDSLDGAIDHIARFGTGHSEAIVTGDLAAAMRFVGEVDAAAVLINASTRFIDGHELGLGAEIGISTQKLHARGPMGLRDLTSLKYVVTGSGQVRQ